MSNIIVSGLAIYPVKSMRQVSLDSSELHLGGLRNDRRWMVVDEDGNMITQRECARLCLIQPRLFVEGVVLSVQDFSDLKVYTPDKNMMNVKVWDDVCHVYDAGDEAAVWLSDFLKMKCRLVYFPDDEVRIVDQTYAEARDQTAFSDGFPVLIISQDSLDYLNSQMDAPVEMARFRPNIVVSGCEPFAEDNWKVIKIGELQLRLVKPCSRCIIPSINIETSEKGREPLRTLVACRKRGKKVYFGQNGILDGNGNIKTGMKIEVVQ